MNHLKDWLETRNMTQDELAALLGVTRETVNRMVHAEQPSTAFIGKFYRTFGSVETDAAFPQPQEA